jgi:hypothetical protein
MTVNYRRYDLQLTNLVAERGDIECLENKGYSGLESQTLGKGRPKGSVIYNFSRYVLTWNVSLDYGGLRTEELEGFDELD